MTSVETWNARARWCCTYIREAKDKDPEGRALRRMARWRELERATKASRRELLAAAHQGLTPGRVADLLAEHSRGCLVLGGGVGEGKTTGAAWRCYTGTETVVWLAAPEVGQADTRGHRDTLRRIGDAGLVVLDDVGAAGSFGRYETARVVEVITKLAGTAKPSIVTTNLGRESFGMTYDGELHGRLVDRLTMPPNRFEVIPLATVSRRASAAEPLDELPPAESKAKAFLDALALCRVTEQALTPKEVHAEAVRKIAGRLGVRSDEELDARVRDHDRARWEASAAVGRLIDEHRMGDEGT